MTTAFAYMRKVVLAIGLAVVLLISSTAVRTDSNASTRTRIDLSGEATISAGAAGRLAGALRIPTISLENGLVADPVAFQQLHAYLEGAFPRVHSQLQREVVGAHSLLYSWRGSDPSLKPILFVGHMDVVPVEPGTEHKWSHDPFSGRVLDGFIWGRGAIDNKSAVVGMLESVDMLLKEGFRPSRTVYLAFGHDEEVGGTYGARSIATLLKQRGVELEMVLDEGGVISDGVLPGVSAPVALVGIAEKGFVSLELTVRGAGGHSSLPPSQTSVGILSTAIAKLEHNPMPARLEGATRQMFDRLGREFPFAQRAVFANLWLTQPLVMHKLGNNPTMNAMIRTTTAATVFHAGAKENVLPAFARAVVNFRILPGDSVADVVNHVEAVIDDERVEVRRTKSFSAEPSYISSTESESYRRLERAIVNAAPGVIVAPYLVVVATDSRHYAELSSNIFRFQPVRLSPRDLERMHGSDERIAVSDYAAAIRVYREIMLQAAT